jgi:hypothetical protein
MVRPEGLLTVKDFQNLTHDELFEVMAECGSPGYYQMAVEELQRRFLDNIRAEVRRLHRSSTRLECLTWTLIFLTVILAGFEIRRWFESRSANTSASQGVGLSVRANAADAWDQQALRAELEIPATSADHRLTICTYIVRNGTDHDYSLATSLGVTLMRWDESSKSLDGPTSTVTVRLPLFIPARQKQKVEILVPISETYLPDQRKTYAGTASEPLYRVPAYDGFVLFDPARRYRINFPKCQ